MTFQRETIVEHGKLTPRTVSEKAHWTGFYEDEPLLFGMDGALRYAKAYEKRFGGKLADDYVLGPAWLNWVKGLRELLNGNGVVAMEKDISTDSKDNGVIEGIFWAAMNAAGFTEADL